MPAGYKSEVHDKLLAVVEALEMIVSKCNGYKFATDTLTDAIKTVREVNTRCDKSNLQRVKHET